MEVITTAPSVIYKVHKKDDEIIELYDPSSLPDWNTILFIEEPVAKVSIITPEEYFGCIVNLCIERRGRQTSLEYTKNKMMITYLIPLNEIIFNFSNKIKSLSKGYASFDWEISSYQQEDLVKLDILVNGKLVKELATIIHRSQAEKKGREITAKLKELIPKQLFQIALQAAIGGKVIARENISALRKNVLSKCYGGDITRKRKLIEKQKAGKKRMKSIGNIDIPQDAFIETFKID